MQYDLNPYQNLIPLASINILPLRKYAREDVLETFVELLELLGLIICQPVDLFAAIWGVQIVKDAFCSQVPLLELFELILEFFESNVLLLWLDVGPGVGRLGLLEAPEG